MSEETNYVTKEIFYEEIARAIENVREEIKALRQALAITSPRVIDTAEAEKRHCCPEWDFLEITKDDPEFEACLCFSQKPDAWIADVGEPPTEEEKQEQDTLAYREAARLAQWLFKKHYAHEEHYAYGRVVWGLCDTTAGVITQIDNMVCQLVKAEKQEPVEYIRDMIEGLYENGDPVSVEAAELIDKLYTHPQPKREPLTDEQKDILNFLLGASDIDGAWFSDKHPTEAGQFWWRNRLRKAFQEADHGIEENT